MAPEIADHYLLDSPDAAVGIATDRLREEFGAAAFKARARIILDRVRYCLRGNRAAAVRRAKQQQRWQCRRAHAERFGRPLDHHSLRHWRLGEQSGGGSGGGEAARPGGGAGRTREQLTRRSRARAGGGRGAVGGPTTV